MEFHITNLDEIIEYDEKDIEVIQAKTEQEKRQIDIMNVMNRIQNLEFEVGSYEHGKAIKFFRAIVLRYPNLSFIDLVKKSFKYKLKYRFADLEYDIFLMILDGEMNQTV